MHCLNRALARKGIDVTVYTTNAGLVGKVPLDQEADLDGVKVTYFGFAKLFEFVGTPGWQFSRGLTSALKNNLKDFDLIYIVNIWSYPAAMAAHYSRFYGKPYILVLRPPLSITVADLTDVKADIIFNLFEGFDGEPDSEAAVAEVLEQMGTCFTGSPSRALRLSQNKAAEKQILRSQGIPVPDWQVLSPENLSCFALNFPCIIKPLGEHASHGISADSVVADRDVLSKRIHFIFESYRCQSLVEEFLPGREFCALVVGNEHPHLFPIEEIVYTLPEGKPKILTYAA
ncbi:MAG: hypothetical protein NT066_06440, partial [Candidatus Omnitrophica bacterium]|nr:hypothetical protein [Candidatus Omnitrophota bacterium]